MAWPVTVQGLGSCVGFRRRRRSPVRGSWGFGVGFKAGPFWVETCD